MSALIALMQDENLTSVFETVFMESAEELLAGLNEEDLEKVAKYVALLKEKQVKPSEEEAVSEALVPFLEHNAALYGTFLYESVGEVVDEKKLLENIRNYFESGREFIIETLSDVAKARLKKAAKIGAGVAGAGVAAYGAYKHGDDALKGAKKILGLGKDASETRDSHPKIIDNRVVRDSHPKILGLGKDASETRDSHPKFIDNRDVRDSHPKFVDNRSIRDTFKDDKNVAIKNLKAGAKKVGEYFSKK